MLSFPSNLFEQDTEQGKGNDFIRTQDGTAEDSGTNDERFSN